MKYYSYNKEIITATAEIIRLFSNISIPNLHGSTDDNGHVRCLNGQTSRVLKSILNPTAASFSYPLICIEKGSMRIDKARNRETNYDISIMTSPVTYDPNTRPPTPVDIDFTINIFAKYPEDIDMIVSNFVPFFNTDVFVRTPHPKLPGKYLTHQVIWDGNVNWDWKSSLQNTEQDIQIAKTNFTYKTEIFGGDTVASNDKGAIIHNIILDYSETNGSINTEYNPESKNNLLGGFYAVPYSEDFSSYSKKLINNTLRPMPEDAESERGYAVYDSLSISAYDELFNKAVMENDLEAAKDAISNGASIYKYSYWPYAYANSLGYTDIVKLIVDSGGRTSKITPRYIKGEKFNIADLPK